MKIKNFSFSLLLVGVLSWSTAHAFTPMLPLVHERGAEISGWLMSEKLDGVRAYWDGHQLYSRNGLKFNPPVAFTANFPDFPLEGELWAGRNTFTQTLGTIKRKNAHDGWLKLKLAVFDVPEAPGGFEERLQTAEEWFTGNPSPYVFVIEHRPVESEEHLREELRLVEELGGEGLMLRRAGSLYTSGRSSDMLKVKSRHDMEAIVLAHLPGQGRNEGRMGSLLVQLPDRTEFRLGTGFSDKERENPPAIGSSVTFSYSGFLESGIPRFPSFLRIREEL